jgi:hypothetical protein
LALSVARTIKFAWKEICGIAFFAVLLAFALYQLYGAWAFGLVAVPWRVLRRISVATLAGDPIAFWIGVAFWALEPIVLIPVIWLLIFGLRSEARSFRIREARPPLDDGIRQPVDQR